MPCSITGIQVGKWERAILDSAHDALPIYANGLINFKIPVIGNVTSYRSDCIYRLNL